METIDTVWKTRLIHYSLPVADVDECVTPANNCKFECKNLIGSFACICPEGYVQIGSDECKDINECTENPNICQNGYCVNLSGSYKCECYDGFKTSYDGRQCIGNELLRYASFKRRGTRERNSRT